VAGGGGGGNSGEGSSVCFAMSDANSDYKMSNNII